MQYRELFGLEPARRDHIPAFRIAIGVAIPLLLLLATHRLDLAIYATFGAFTGIYARHETPGLACSSRPGPARSSRSA